MLGEVSKRAAHYREQSEPFQRLADMEDQPHARAQLRQIADAYEQLAATKPPNRALNGSLRTYRPDSP